MPQGMNRIAKSLIAVGMLGALAFGVKAYATPDYYTPATVAGLTRPCAYYSGTNYQVTTAVGSSAQSTASAVGTANYRVLCTTDSYFAQGTNPTAGTTSGRFITNLPELVVLRSGDKLAFRAVTTIGNCDVTECK